MIDTLTKDQIDFILRSQTIARLGCSANNQVYVAPISYVYDGKYLYARSKEGLKINIMRKNPNVCMEIDSIDTMANWRCVIAQGKFEEIKADAAQNKILKLIKDRFTPLLTSRTLIPHSLETSPYYMEKEVKSIVFRIVIEKISGRYEKTN